MSARVADRQQAGSGSTPTGRVLGDGRYAVTRVLGEGSQGQTLEAIDKKDGTLVALKVFRIRGAESWKDVELAEREARVLSQLQHPALPAYIDHFEEGGALVLVMERIEGSDLETLRRRGQRLSERQVVAFLRSAADILDYLHGRAPPVIHRDIKPGNVLRREDGTFALVDFGAVRDKLKPEGSTVVGTFGFMAPEQFQGRALPASDVYAVGTTALSLLTGLPPEELPHSGLAIDVERALSGRTSPALRRALAAMTQPNPDERAPRIAPLLLELPAEAASSPPSQKEKRHAASPSSPPSQSPRAMSDTLAHPMVTSLLLLLMFVLRVVGTLIFAVLLPTLLTLLSILPPLRFLRGLARNLRATMRSLDERLQRGGQRLRDHADEVGARRHAAKRQRVRVPTEQPRQRAAAQSRVRIDDSSPEAETVVDTTARPRAKRRARVQRS